MAYWNKEIECMPREQMREMQLRSIRRVVEHHYASNKFYHDRLKEHGVRPSDIQSLADVSKLPFMYKQDLRDNYPLSLFSSKPKDLVRYHVSSGTTGKPTLVGYTRGDLDYWSEAIARSLTSIGVNADDTLQVSYGYGLFTGGLGLHYGAEKVGATVLPSSTGGTERQIELMMDLGVSVIACTPSYLIHIGEVAERMGISIRNDTKLRLAVLGAEPWTNNMRRKIEDSMGIKAYDIFGMSEMAGPMFSDCPEKNGVHIQSDMAYAEIIDPKTGEVLEDGEKGELVITMLRKEAFPLIRYRTKDLTYLMSDDCPCGRTSPRIAKISGRSDDMLIIRGINVFPSQVEHALMQIPEVGNQYRIVVDRKGALDEMTVQVELKEDAYSDSMADMQRIQMRIASELKKYLNIAVKVDLREVGTLPRFEGKSTRVVDKRVIE